MHPDQEDFEQLRKLLVLKRYEQPPPGYFDRFSLQVIARIRAGETGSHRTAWFELAWWDRVWTVLESKPSFAGAFGVIACGLLLTGVIYSERADVDPRGLAAVPTAGALTVGAFGGNEEVILTDLDSRSSSGLRREPFFHTPGPTYFPARTDVQRVNYFEVSAGK